MIIKGVAYSFQGIPLYAHVSDLAGTKKPYVLPVPFMNVLNGGYVETNAQYYECYNTDCSVDPTLVDASLSRSS